MQGTSRSRADPRPSSVGVPRGKGDGSREGEGPKRGWTGRQDVFGTGTGQGAAVVPTGRPTSPSTAVGVRAVTKDPRVSCLDKRSGQEENGGRRGPRLVGTVEGWRGVVVPPVLDTQDSVSLGGTRRGARGRRPSTRVCVGTSSGPVSLRILNGDGLTHMPQWHQFRLLPSLP